MPFFRSPPEIKLPGTEFSVFIYCSGKKLSQGSYNYFHLTPSFANPGIWSRCQHWLSSRLALSSSSFKGFKLIFCFRGKCHKRPQPVQCNTRKVDLLFHDREHYEYHIDQPSTLYTTIEAVKTALVNCRTKPQYKTAKDKNNNLIVAAIDELIRDIKNSSLKAPRLVPLRVLAQVNFSAVITLLYMSTVDTIRLDSQAKIQRLPLLLPLPTTLLYKSAPHTVFRIEMSCRNDSRIFAKLTIAHGQKDSKVAKYPMPLLFYAAAYNSGLYSRKLLNSQIHSYQYNIEPDLLGAIVQDITQSFA